MLPRILLQQAQYILIDKTEHLFPFIVYSFPILKCILFSSYIYIYSKFRHAQTLTSSHSTRSALPRTVLGVEGKDNQINFNLKNFISFSRYTNSIC